MKSVIKRFIHLTLAAILLLSLPLSANALTSISTSSLTSATATSREQDIVEKVSEMLPLIYAGILDDCYLGDEISAYRVTQFGLERIDYEIYPVFSSGEIVAVAQAVDNDVGELIVSCMVAFSPELQTFRSGNRNSGVALLFAIDGVYIVADNQVPVQIYETVNAGLCSVSNVSVQRNSLELRSIEEAQSFTVTSASSQLRSIQFLTLQVPFVNNGKVNPACQECNDIGLCWAASIAMIANYYRGTTFGINQVHSSAGCLSKSGTAAQFRSALGNFGMYTNAAASTFNYSTIVTLTQGGRLSFMRLEATTPNSNGKKVGHIIVPRGYYWDGTANGTRSFYFNDPNYGGGIQSFPTSGSLFVTTSGVKYAYDYHIAAWW